MMSKLLNEAILSQFTDCKWRKGHDSAAHTSVGAVVTPSTYLIFAGGGGGEGMHDCVPCLLAGHCLWLMVDSGASARMVSYFFVKGAGNEFEVGVVFSRGSEWLWQSVQFERVWCLSLDLGMAVDVCYEENAQVCPVVLRTSNSIPFLCYFILFAVHIL